MKIEVRAGEPSAIEADALIVPITAGDGIASSPLAAALDSRLEGELARLAEDARFSGKLATKVIVPTLSHVMARRIVLVGMGAADELAPDRIRRAWGAATVAARDAGALRVASALPPSGDSIDAGRALALAAEGVQRALYRFTRHFGTARSDDPAPRTLERFTFAGESVPEEADAALARGAAIAAAIDLARDLVNEPASVLSPEAFAEHARAVGDATGLTVEVLGPAELDAMGAGAIAAVGRGSANEPRLIRLSYRPANATGGDERVVGLVGKGITFDTGGYSIKPYEGMLEMKGDMAGAAAVLGTMSALAALDCPLPVEATLCCAENMISDRAFRPGDILTALNGVTIEILSTDAEGRLVLADGLVDTARRGATELIDVATLTGAAIVALGDGTTALFASDDRLAGDLLSAADRAGERFWRMPLIEEFNEKIKGNVGDIKNSGGRPGGAITAALFLRHFREGLPWAHLDIAPSARTDKNGASGPRGATGVAVRTLLTYLTGA